MLFEAIKFVIKLLWVMFFDTMAHSPILRKENDPIFLVENGMAIFGMRIEKVVFDKGSS